jgi:signal transduction histidine kinase
MLSQLISEQSNSFSDIKFSAKKLSSYSHQLNQSMSEIIWASDPKNDSLEKFLDYLKQYALNFFADSKVKVTIDFPNVNTALLLSPELKRNLFLIAKEALNNSLKYAEANDVHLSFTINSNQFEFTISDNGKGFLMDEKRQTGNGIHNITQRVKNIKGQLLYSAQPGAGCRILIIGNLV